MLAEVLSSSIAFLTLAIEIEKILVNFDAKRIVFVLDSELIEEIRVLNN